MDYPLSLSYNKPPSPIFTNIFSTRTPTKLPYFIHSRAQPQSQASVNNINGPLVVSAKFSQCHGTSSPSNTATALANDDGRGIAAALIKSSEARAAGASLAMACVVGAFCCGFALINPSKAAAAGPGRRTWPRSFISSGSSAGQHVPKDDQDRRKLSPTNPAAAKTNRTDALKAFFEVMVYLASPAAASLPAPRMNIREDVHKLKLEALEQIKKRKNINAALKQMEKKHVEFSKNDPEGQYFVEMALVEILISQGNYKKASEYRDFLEGKFIRTDIRPSLYKAIIYTMLDNDENNPPQECWNDFFGSDELPNPGASPDS